MKTVIFRRNSGIVHQTSLLRSVLIKGATSVLACLALLASIMLAAFLPSQVMASTPDFWKKSGFSFQGNDTPLHEVLKEFSLSYGVELIVSPGVSGYVEGWHRADAGDEFLSKLGVKYQFQWFVFKGKLYISPNSDDIVKRIKVDKKSSVSVEDALKGVDLFEKKFGWGELKQEGVVLVSGPKAYVDLVVDLIEHQEEDKDERDVMVFALKHASVSDREIQFRDKKINIPGAATILQNLLEGSSGKVNVIGQQIKEAPENTLLQQNAASGLGSKNKVEVEGDVRTNSIVIRDDRKKKWYYERLINKIDIEKKLIEIEAIIVDIDRSNLQEFGVNWKLQNAGDSFSLNILNSLTQLSRSINGSATIEINDVGGFQAMLQALESSGNASVMANTSILTVENQPAVFDLSETHFLQTVGERVVDVESITAGTLLNVIPRNVIGGGGSQVQLVIDIEDGQIVAERDDQLPRVKKITINTSAVVDEGRSLVVGGYNIQSDSDTNNKVPVLGDIPLIGKAFQARKRVASKRERLFILTPRISNFSNVAAVESPLKFGDSFNKLNGASNRNAADQVQKLFASIARGEIPQGYEMKKMQKGRRPVDCQIPGGRADAENVQYIVGKDIEIFVSTVENVSNRTIELNERSCHDNNVLAVTFWPYVSLSPRQKTEYYVAKLRNPKNDRMRPSLLN